MNFKRVLSFLIFLTLFYSCSRESVEDSIDLKINSKILQVEIAATDTKRAQGLMNRDSLGKNNGMIFVFDKERAVSFWMKNTLIPLSIAYIDKKGVILEIYSMKPLSTEPIQSKRSSILYALEVNEGYFKDNGIKVGDRVELETLYNYLKSSI
ncbi:DUF192 domain-containing protein [Thiospirochaeta perfilievii]|uniref:DUF192 domain-containing protein n=1 Tax=Thiospirochaeta perfilievii TaxID=252967 RepID=A0A5C1Q9D1_9SPIO|nr:DUF192 domain-containing protein [Thiospirochaeta perfilievii]QEN03244.1 DUF192 domain-containing protein [Thiospirochaeta perfilievii]